MATTATPIKTQRTMVEIRAPEQFQFSDQNRALAGTLLDISEVEIKGKPTLQHMIREERGRRLTFLATYDLQRKIHREHIGHWIDVTYEGEDKSVQTQGSPLKKFKVQVCEEKEPGF